MVHASLTHNLRSHREIHLQQGVGDDVEEFWGAMLNAVTVCNGHHEKAHATPIPRHSIGTLACEHSSRGLGCPHGRPTWSDIGLQLHVAALKYNPML